MKIYYIITIFCININLFSQDLHDNVWLFGHLPNIQSRNFGGTMIEFSNFNVNFFNINFHFTDCAIFSDSSGNLIAYTNGCNIQTGQHKLLQNGDTLLPGDIFNDYCDTPIIYYPSGNSCLFIPGFDEESIVLFQIGFDDRALQNIFQVAYLIKRGEIYSVESKKQISTTKLIAEGIQAIRHGNGRDWWIVLKEVPGNKYLTYLFSKTGIQGPFQSKIGHSWDQSTWIVQSSFSPNGNWYASLSEYNGLSLIKFNRCNGNFEQFFKLNHPPQDTFFWYPRGGVCFSPNSRYLYVSAMFGLYQYDLLSSNIENSGILIDTVDYYFRTITPFPSTFFQMQLGPDGRIYCNTHNQTNFFHVIHFPDKRGRDCMLKQHDLFLPSLYFQSMPNFAHYRTYDWDGSPCDTLGINKLPRANFRYVQDSLDFKLIEFVDLSAYQATSWSWDFGDPNSMQNTSKDQHPIHQFSDKGSYRVCLTATNRHGNHIFCDTLHIGTVSADDVPPIKIEHQVVMMPNPCSDFLYFNFNNYLPQHLTVKISTLSGQLCMQTRISPLHNKLRIDQLLPGAYYVQLFENGKLIRREMVVKE